MSSAYCAKLNSDVDQTLLHSPDAMGVILAFSQPTSMDVLERISVQPYRVVELGAAIKTTGR